ncbi:extensin family protein [Sphingomonas sp. ACRSK]|uniref:extensin family protein n=1 Tax=Sphingomonas sp. ACRSK TaxID=2918213 RepID=UPI001EF450D5|nr:extensin family protein [Sphingomonas sp. ACRSK]MCG7346724.1 extensin family protein [Sphingomonas sp. ACRSK]
MHLVSRRFFTLLLPFLLTACIFGGGREERRPAPRPRGSGPVTLTGQTPPGTQQCFADLSRAGVRFSPLPDRDYGGGCLVLGAVQLIDFGTPTAGLKAIRCPTARAFVGWVQYGVGPAARQILGSDVVRIESYGSYVCRGIVGQGAAGSAKLSQHGLANAIDIGGFVLADGRRISIEQGWRSGDPAVQQFLQVVHRSACRRFKTVLGPDYNAAHYNHLHFDMGGRGDFCR